MTREEKLEHIRKLDRVKEHYEDAIEVIKSNTTKYHFLHRKPIIKKILAFIGVRNSDINQFEYSENIYDEELAKVVIAYMESKISECDAKMDNYFCDDGNGIQFANKSISELKEMLNK